MWPSLANSFLTDGFMGEFRRLGRELDDLFHGVRWDAEAGGYPAVNIWSNPDGAIVTAEVPGLGAEDLEVTVIGDTLTIRGARKLEDPGEKVRYHRRERGGGEFVRTVGLPFQVSAEGVEARCEKGILQVKLPRVEAEKPKRISVKAS